MYFTWFFHLVSSDRHNHPCSAQGRQVKTFRNGQAHHGLYFTALLNYVLSKYYVSVFLLPSQSHGAGRTIKLTP